MQPIKPHEVPEKQAATMPPEVIKAFNDLILKKFQGSPNNGSATIYQSEAVEAIMENLGCKRNDVFANKLLDVEPTFRAAGWHVEYDKPGHNESYEAYFKFRAIKRG